MGSLVIDIFPLEFEETKDLDYKCIRIVEEVVIERLGFREEEVGFLTLNGF